MEVVAGHYRNDGGQGRHTVVPVCGRNHDGSESGSDHDDCDELVRTTKSYVLANVVMYR